jgi:hypothetical protein
MFSSIKQLKNINRLQTLEFAGVAPILQNRPTAHRAATTIVSFEIFGSKVARATNDSTADVAAVVDADGISLRNQPLSRALQIVIASGCRPMCLLGRSPVCTVFSPAGCPLQQIMVASSSEFHHF